MLSLFIFAFHTFFSAIAVAPEGIFSIASDIASGAAAPSAPHTPTSALPLLARRAHPKHWQGGAKFPGTFINDCNYRSCRKLTLIDILPTNDTLRNVKDDLKEEFAASKPSNDERVDTLQATINHIDETSPYEVNSCCLSTTLEYLMELSSLSI